MWHPAGGSEFKYDPNNAKPVQDISSQNYLNRWFTGFKRSSSYWEGAFKPALQLPAASIGWEMSKNDYSSIAICISAARLVSALTLQNQDFEEKSKKAFFSIMFDSYSLCVREILFHKFGRCKSDFILGHGYKYYIIGHLQVLEITTLL